MKRGLVVCGVRLVGFDLLLLGFVCFVGVFLVLLFKIKKNARLLKILLIILDVFL